MTPAERCWPAEGVARVPYWVYSDAALFDHEQERIFRGPVWNFLCLEAELPKPNTYRTSSAGAMPLLGTRDAQGRLSAFEEPCAPRGSLLFIQQRGPAPPTTLLPHHTDH